MGRAFRFIIATVVLSFTLPFLFSWVDPDVTQTVITWTLYAGAVSALIAVLVVPIGVILTTLFGVPQPRIAYLERKKF